MKKIPLIIRSTTVASIAALTLVSFSLPAQAAQTKNPINTSSRASVSEAYKTRWLPATKSSVNWTGVVAGCKPGAQSADSLSKGAQAINFYRGLSGLDSISLNSTQNSKAQAAALIMEANQSLTHYPATNAKCYTPLGAAGAGSSNLYGGWSSVPRSMTIDQPIAAYMSDYGDSNTAVGHRRWFLNPTTTTMGLGTTANFNAVNVFGGSTSANNAQPTWMPYPNAGYTPQQLEPNGRWSISTSQNYNLENTTIAVKDSSGKVLPVKKYPVANGYGPNTVVFEVSGVKAAVGTAESAYTVTLANVKTNTGASVANYTYTTKLFDGNVAGNVPVPTPTPTPTPTPPPTTPVANPSIKGLSDLVAVDGAGTLWNYRDLKSSRVKIGAGWQGMTQVLTADWNTDGIVDIVAKDKTGGLHLYAGNKTGGFTKTTIGNGWTNYDVDIAKWKTGDKNPSIIARNVKDGSLWIYANPTGKSPGTRTLVGSGWQNLTVNTLDWDRNGNLDVIAKNASGQMKLYRTNGQGNWVNETRATVGSGWNSFTSVTTIRNFQGKSDGIIAKNSNGDLFFYGANKNSWAAPAKIGAGWKTYNIASA